MIEIKRKTGSSEHVENESQIVKPLLCFGEALIDFLYSGFDSENGIEIANFRQFPGGAPANAAVAFARLGGTARFAGQVGDDPFGNFLERSLAHYGVDVRLLYKHPTASTSLAFVFLDNDGDRSFSFYRDKTADMLFSIDQVSEEWFSDGPIFHVCSNTLTSVGIAAVTEYALQQAGRANCFISFDVNLRANLWPDDDIDRPRCDAAIRCANFVKCAKEELEFLANGDEVRYIDGLLAGKTRLIVITNGGSPVLYHTRHHHGSVEVPPVGVVDTTAAGDAFTAAVLRCLCAATDIESAISDPECIESVVKFAVQCGALTVSRSGAFPALPVFDEVAEFWSDMP